MAGETYKAAVVTQQPTITTVGPWTAYTPQLLAVTTNPTLGSGALQSGRYTQLGKLVVAEFTVQFGSTGLNVGSGNYSISLPVNSKNTTNDEGAGQGWMFDASANRVVLCFFRMFSSNSKADIYYTSTAIPFQASNSAPWVWATTDFVQGQLMYEAA
jgi:hypothetical protein